MGDGNIFLEKGFKRVKSSRASQAMTVAGTSIKTILLLLVLSISAGYTWNLLVTGKGYIANKLIIIGALIVAILTCLSPQISRITSFIYAIFEGLALGSISYFAERWYPGIVLSAIMLTIATALAVMMIYKSIGGISGRFRRIITISIIGIGLSYILTFVLSLFDIGIPFIHSNGPLGILISLIVVFIAASSLLLDYDFVYNASRYGAPKYMEWYGAFSILVTLVWMYIEILELLEKIKD
ncbi:Bax inhibitor-1/YccA family protein [uncultured Clostridium sp.]|uniref:Bax inhibitor-1/YccA family protein n=1 Tax=uncultured Clostridium sp. TaxID=59620 RepID=UPI0032172DEB